MLSWYNHYIAMLEILLANPFFIQFVGFIALIFALLIFQVNDRKSMLKFHAIASLFFAAHYLMLGAIAGALVSIINVLRSYCFFKSEGKKFYKLVPIIFITVFVIAIILSWQGWASLLPMASAIVGTLAFWQNKPRRIRAFSLLISPLWLIYDALVCSYPGMITELFMLSSNIVGVCRYDLSKNYRFKKDFKMHVHRKRLHP